MFKKINPSGQGCDWNSLLLAHQHSFGAVEHRLGALQQVSAQILETAQDVASIKSLFQSPKWRGTLGELLLADLLSQVLPAHAYALQYSFLDRQKVDAVIHLSQGMVPIDAKFPLENFERMHAATDTQSRRLAHKQFVQDIKKHIDDIAQKYIRPAEGTLEFALMYIPSESVYYEMITQDSVDDHLLNYAIKHKVLAVSPTSFYAYLETIARGLKGLRIEQSARAILDQLGKLENDMRKFFLEFEKLGNHLRWAQSSYEKSQLQAMQVNRQMASLNLHHDPEFAVSGTQAGDSDDSRRRQATDDA